MSMEIYYFSGMGNSLAVARDMAERLNARLIAVGSTLDRENVESEADGIGFVFPVYDFKPSQVVEACIPKLVSVQNLGTYSEFPTGAMKTVSSQ